MRLWQTCFFLIQGFPIFLQLCSNYFLGKFFFVLTINDKRIFVRNELVWMKSFVWFFRFVWFQSYDPTVNIRNGHLRQLLEFRSKTMSQYNCFFSSRYTYAHDCRWPTRTRLGFYRMQPPHTQSHTHPFPWRWPRPAIPSVLHVCLLSLLRVYRRTSTNEAQPIQ